MGRLKCKINGHKYWSKGLSYTNDITIHNECHVKIWMICKECGTKWVVIDYWMKPNEYTNFVLEKRLEKAKKELDETNCLNTSILFDDLEYTGARYGKPSKRKPRFVPNVRKSVQRFINR